MRWFRALVSVAFQGGILVQACQLIWRWCTCLRGTSRLPLISRTGLRHSIPPSLPRLRPAVAATPMDVISVQRRQAALQRRVLSPLQRKDLSQLEQELDQKYNHLVVLPQDQSEQGELTTAEKIRREWQAINKTQPVTQSEPITQRGFVDPEGVVDDGYYQGGQSRNSSRVFLRPVMFPN